MGAPKPPRSLPLTPSSVPPTLRSCTTPRALIELYAQLYESDDDKSADDDDDERLDGDHRLATLTASSTLLKHFTKKSNTSSTPAAGFDKASLTGPRTPAKNTPPPM